MNPIQELKHRIDTQGNNIWSKSIQLNRKEYLKVKGSTDTNLYYVVEGTLRIFIEDDFEEHTIRLGYKDSFIAALDSFISEAPSPFYIQAIKKCELLVAPKTAFMDFIKNDPSNLALWLDITSHLIYQGIEREIDILTHSPVERYQRVFARSPHLFQEIPAKYIASYLRMTPETLSRIKKS